MSISPLNLYTSPERGSEDKISLHLQKDSTYELSSTTTTLSYLAAAAISPVAFLSLLGSNPIFCRK